VPEPIQTSNFPRLSAEDTVSLEITATEPGTDLEIVLETATDVTRWKALEVRSLDGRLLTRVRTHEADHGPHAVTVEAARLPGARLVLAKATMLGIRTGRYELRDLDVLAGRRLYFRWQRDDHRDGPVAGFFRDLGGGVNRAADTAAGAAETAANAAAEGVSDLIETAGTFLRDALDMIGGLAGRIPGTGRPLRALLHWYATWVSSSFDLIATCAKTTGDLAGKLLAGTVRIAFGGLGSLLAGDNRVFFKGWADIIGGTVGALIMVAGKTLAFVQAGLGLQYGERPLTAAEHRLLSDVYRGSVALYNVRVVDGFGGLAGITDRPFTLGNTIYLKSDPDPSVLVHECCHVWQYQHAGAAYTIEALVAQRTLKDEGYPWVDELGRGHLRWQDFNREAAAQFVQDLWNWGSPRLPPTPVPETNGVFFTDDPVGPDVVFVFSDQEDHTSLALETVAHIRNNPAIRLSSFIQRHTSRTGRRETTDRTAEPGNRR
jgi:hypothetical protein